MGASQLNDPVVEWAEPIRELIRRGVSVPVVVLAFLHYRIGPVSWGDPVSSVAAALGKSPDEIGNEVVTVCGDPARVESVVEELLKVHETLDQLPNLERGPGLIPVAAKVMHEWRGYAHHRGWRIPGSIVSPQWAGFLREFHAAGAGLFELEHAARRYRVHLVSGEMLHPLGIDAAKETVCAVLKINVDEHRRQELAGVMDGAEAVRAALEFLPEKLRGLKGVLEVAELPFEGFGQDRFVAARGMSTLVPPWLRFPEPIQSSRWRMGAGEDYMTQWHGFWRSLTSEARTAYFIEHPVPAEWRGWVDHLLDG